MSPDRAGRGSDGASPAIRRVLVLLATLVLSLTTLAAVPGPATTTSEPDAAPDLFRQVVQLDRPLALSGPGERAAVATEIALPDDAAQGPDQWYVLEARLRIDFTAPAAPGSSGTLSLLTGGYAAAQLQFEQGWLLGQSAVRWRSLDLFAGSRQGVTFARSLTLPFGNYLQVRGVEPGRSQLTLQVEQEASGPIAAVELLAGSGIARGSLGPPALQIELSTPVTTVQVGHVVPLEYRLLSNGYPAREVGLALGGLDAGLVAVESPAIFTGWLIEQRGVIHLRALAPGRYQLTALTTAQGRRGPQATLAIQVVP